MKTTFALLAATAATAQAGMCCCDLYLLNVYLGSNGYDCTAGDYSDYSTWDCKGTPTAWTGSYDCATDDAGAHTEANCADQTLMFANSGQRCAWNSAATTALGATAAAAAVIAYTL